MDAPVLLAQASPAHPDEVAVMFSFVPQFEGIQQTTELETAVEERPEPQEIPGEYVEENNYFIFIVDRSGSMSGTKMETTKEALTLFLKSLPSDSYFDIISFGDKFIHMG
jgi:uncharacterized protein with von Willebrand factor type A (vWA) domain